MPFVVGGFAGLILLGLWLYVILEVITTDSVVCRNLPKGAWIILVIFLPEIGSIAWLLLGRPQNQRFNLNGNFQPPTASRRPAPRGIEDRDDWPAAARKLLNEPEPEREDPEVEKQKIRDAADERARKLREWESRLIQREKELHEREQNKNDGEPS
jgi:hypothetical protein